MSYGVVAHKPVHLKVEPIAQERGPGYDPRRERYQRQPVTLWTAGRITLTHLSLTYVPTGRQRGDSHFTLALRDIEAVEASGRGLNRVITLRTQEALIHFKATGAMGLATQIAQLAEQARKTAPATKFIAASVRVRAVDHTSLISTVPRN